MYAIENEYADKYGSEYTGRLRNNVSKRSRWNYGRIIQIRGKRRKKRPATICASR